MSLYQLFILTLIGCFDHADLILAHINTLSKYANVVVSSQIFKKIPLVYMSGSVALVLDYIERKDYIQIKAYS